MVIASPALYKNVAIGLSIAGAIWSTITLITGNAYMSANLLGSLVALGITGTAAVLSSVFYAVKTKSAIFASTVFVVDFVVLPFGIIAAHYFMQ